MILGYQIIRRRKDRTTGKLGLWEFWAHGARVTKLQAEEIRADFLCRGDKCRILPL